MKSKWIIDVERAIDNDDLFELYIEDYLNIIDKILRKAMNSTDNPNLYDEIYNLINGKPMMTSDNYGEFEDDKPKEN